MSTESGPPLNVTALVTTLMEKSGVLWIDIPGDRAWPAWYAWGDGTAYVLTGPGEQRLPWLPPEVALALRSQDSGGRLVKVRASAEVLGPASPDYESALTALQAGRLNAAPDAITRWRETCSVIALSPFGAPLETPEDLGAFAGRAVPASTPATTANWRPTHWRGRGKRR